MSNREIIEKAIGDAGFTLKRLTFERVRDCAYGDSWDASYWVAETECGEMFTSGKGDTVAEGIALMLEELGSMAKSK